MRFGSIGPKGISLASGPDRKFTVAESVPYSRENLPNLLLVGWNTVDLNGGIQPVPVDLYPKKTGILSASLISASSNFRGAPEAILLS